MTGVINDPLGQPTAPAGSDCRLILKFWDGRTDGRTLCVKIVITTGPDFQLRIVITTGGTVSLAMGITDDPCPVCKYFQIFYDGSNFTWHSFVGIHGAWHIFIIH